MTGEAEQKIYYCPIADYMNITLIRYAAIGDGSCLLHAIFTLQPNYKFLPIGDDDQIIKKGKPKSKKEFIQKLRNMMVKKLSNFEEIWKNIDGSHPQFFLNFFR